MLHIINSNFLKSSLILLFLLIPLINDSHSQVTQSWTGRYNGTLNGADQAFSIVTDGSGNVYITGLSNNASTGGDIVTIKYLASGLQQWAGVYSSPGNFNDGGYSIALDVSNNVYVSGYISTGSSYNFATIKYNPIGTFQWIQTYNGTGDSNDVAVSNAVDASGNIYVTGSSMGNGSGYDYATIKYNSSGVQQWITRYNGPGNGNDIPSSLTIDASGNVYVTGYSTGNGTSIDYTTIKYNTSGVQQWVQRYDGPINNTDNAVSVVVDASGNSYVTGSSYGNGTQSDYATIKYNSLGIQQWVARYNGTANNNDNASSIKIDASGNVIVTGTANMTGTGQDFVTVKYNSSGVQQWVTAYNGSLNILDQANSLAVDAFGNIYVTGTSQETGTSEDCTTIKYNSSGVQQWVQRYNGPPGNSQDRGMAIVVDAAGNVNVTGNSVGTGTSWDFATIKYIQSPNAPTNLTTSTISYNRINLNWTDNSGNETGFKIERSTNAGTNWTLRDSTSQNATSYSDSGLTANRTYHYRIYAYNIAGGSVYSNISSSTTFMTGITGNNSVLPDKIALMNNYPNPFNPVTTICFDIPDKEKYKNSPVHIDVFNPLGQIVSMLVNQKLLPGRYQVGFDASHLVSGIYFYRMKVGDFEETKKMILVK